jgi:type IV pilus assembly protein PilB
VALRVRIGQLLVEAGFIDPWQLQSALGDQERFGGRLGAALVRRGFISEPALLAQVAGQLGVPYVQLAGRPIQPAVVRLVPEKLIHKHGVFPIAHAPRPRRGLLVVATSDPENLASIDEISFATGLAVHPALASENDIAHAIQLHLGPDPSAPPRTPGKAPPLPGAHAAHHHH